MGEMIGFSMLNGTFNNMLCDCNGIMLVISIFGMGQLRFLPNSSYRHELLGNYLTSCLTNARLLPFLFWDAFEA